MLKTNLENFTFNITVEMNNTMIEILIIKQMIKEFKHTKKEIKVMNEHIKGLRIFFENEFHKHNKDKLKDFHNLIER